MLIKSERTRVGSQMSTFEIRKESSITYVKILTYIAKIIKGGSDREK